jgi:hypothetical protein
MRLLSPFAFLRQWQIFFTYVQYTRGGHGREKLLTQTPHPVKKIILRQTVHQRT